MNEQVMSNYKKKGQIKASSLNIKSLLKGSSRVFLPFRHEFKVFKLPPVKVILHEHNMARGGKNLELLQTETAVHEKRRKLGSSLDRA